MFGKDFKIQKAGKGISARKINQTFGTIDRLCKLRTSNGINFQDLPGGGGFVPTDVLFLTGVTGSGGIEGRSSGGTLGRGEISLSRFVVQDDGSVTTNVSTETMDVYNLAQGRVAANAWVIVAYILGVWIVIWEECPQDGG